MPYTVPEFAAVIKQKYPEYQSWPDDHLVTEIVAKHPEYRTWVSDPATSARPGTSMIGGIDPASSKPSNFFGSIAADNPLIPDDTGAPESALGGVVKGVRGAISSISKPSNIATTAGAIALGALTGPPGAAVIAGGFAAMQLPQLWDEAKAAYYASGPDRWYHATNTVITGALVAGGVKAAKGFVADAIAGNTIEASNVGKLIKDTRDALNPMGVSSNAKMAGMTIMEMNAKKAIAKDSWRSLYEHHATVLDSVYNKEELAIINDADEISGNLAVKYDEASKLPYTMLHPIRMLREGAPKLADVNNSIKALGSVLAEKLDALPDKEAERIDTADSISPNPIEDKLQRIFEADKSALSARATSVLMSEGLLKNFRAPFDEETGRRVKLQIPEGWDYIKSPMFKYNEMVDPATGEYSGVYEKNGRMYAPKDVANLINNYLRPGLAEKQLIGPVYNIYRGAGSVLNQFQLGFSGFHAIFDTMDAMSTGVGLGLKKFFAGQYGEGLAKIGESMTPLYPYKTYKAGAALAEAAKFGAEGEMGQLVDALQKAGGRTSMTADLFASKFGPMRQQALKAWRNQGMTMSVGKMLMAAPEMVAYPIMEKMVPNMKLGLFADMAKFQLEQLAAKGASDFEVRSQLTKIWETLDNRMGQVVYDNKFWNKAVKDIGFASVRSLGWNVGTFKEIGGGLVDWLKQPVKAALRQDAEFTWRMSYIPSMLGVTMLYGGLTHYMLSGKMPDSLDDYFFPETASGQRLSLPSYVKDIWEYRESPITTAMSKIHPLATGIADMMMNKDFRNVNITGENPFENIAAGDMEGMQQFFKDELDFVWKQVQPFGLSNVARLTEQGVPSNEAMLSMVGLPPAPQRIVGSTFEREARDAIRKGSPEGGRDKLQAARSTAKLAIEDRMRKGMPINDVIQQAMSAGTLGINDLDEVFTASTKPPLESLASKMPLSDLLRTFNSATNDEKQQIVPVLMKRLQNIGDLPPAQQKEVARYLKNIHLPVVKPLPPPPA